MGLAHALGVGVLPFSIPLLRYIQELQALE
jgi:hypothetical protein